ncbi:uncharacterized protein LOC135196578 [Macrobrachium nipponense]|uniref:uncharacterized protein LOC135196578 n=1 Tax=Macrobrachium nipponense TaxID=159736 RepID=UPI0030C7BAB2
MKKLQREVKVLTNLVGLAAGPQGPAAKRDYHQPKLFGRRNMTKKCLLTRHLAQRYVHKNQYRWANDIRVPLWKQQKWDTKKQKHHSTPTKPNKADRWWYIKKLETFALGSALLEVMSWLPTLTCNTSYHNSPMAQRKMSRRVQQYVGVVEHAVFDESSVPARRIIVATAHNVLAALSTKNGEIVWRHVMEDSDGEGIDLLVSKGSQITIVSGNLLRTWDSVSAALIEEIPLDHASSLSGVLMRAVSLTENEVVLAELVPGSLAMTTLDRSSGAALDHATIAAPWLHDKTK